MKLLFSTILCLFVLNGFGQTNEVIIEEKSSAWIKITEDAIAVSKPPTVKRPTATVKKKSNTSKPAAPKQDVQGEFEKTNQQVNRFKKAKKAN
jgi:hypothetical protein